MDSNDAFLIHTLKTNNEVIKLYLLNPGDWFAGFGGSRAGLVVRKTASLIVRREGPMGTYDTECDINNKQVWQSIFNHVKESDAAERG